MLKGILIAAQTMESSSALRLIEVNSPGVAQSGMGASGSNRTMAYDSRSERNFKLCPYRDALPKTADAFLWSQGPFNKLGRFDGLGDEMRTIVLDSLVEYPGMQITTALAASAKQLVSVATGEGVLTSILHTYGIMERYTPSVVPDMRAARQQHGELHFEALNAVQVPLALGAMAALPLFVILGLRRRAYVDLAFLAATV